MNTHHREPTFTRNREEPGYFPSYPSAEPYPGGRVRQGREPAALNNLSDLTMVQPSLDREQQRKRGMSVLVFVLLTVAIFAVLGLIQKAVERL